MTIHEVAEIAKKHLLEVMPHLASSTIELDELEAPQNSSSWYFTFTSIESFDPNASLAEFTRSRRITKSVELSREDGTLLAIRNQASALNDRPNGQADIRALRGKIKFYDDLDEVRGSNRN